MIACTSRSGQGSRSALARLAAVIALTVTIIVAPSFALTTIALADDVATAGSGQQDDHAATAGDPQADQPKQPESPGGADPMPEGDLTLTNSIAPVGTEDSPSDADLGATPPDQPLCSDTSGVGDTSQGSGQNQPTVENDTSEAARAASHTISGEFGTTDVDDAGRTQATATDASESSSPASSATAPANTAGTGSTYSGAAFGLADPSAASGAASATVVDPLAHASASSSDLSDSTVSTSASSDAILASATSSDTLSAASAVTYKVEYWLQQTDGLFTLDNTVTYSGSVGQVVSREDVFYSDAAYNKWNLDARTAYLDRRPNRTKTAETFTVSADEVTNVFRIYWDLSTKNYTYKYRDEDLAKLGTLTVTPDDLKSWETHTYFGVNTMHVPNITPESLTDPNWKFVGWREESNNWCDGALHRPGSIWGTMWVRIPEYVHVAWPEDRGGVEGVLWAEWRYETPKATFTIEHYQQELDGSFSGTPYETAKKTVELGTTTDAPSHQNHYTGFTYNPNLPGSTLGTVTPLEDGTTVLKLYYERDPYSVTYVYDETAGGPAPIPVPAGMTSVYYGTTVTAETLDVPEGHTFTGWILQYAMPDGTAPTSVWVAQGSSFTMPAADVILTGIWDRKDWIVKFERGAESVTYGSYEYPTAELKGSTVQTGIPDGGHCQYGPGVVYFEYPGSWSVAFFLWWTYTTGQGDSVQTHYTYDPASIAIHQDTTFTAQWGIGYSQAVYYPGSHGSFTPDLPEQTYFSNFGEIPAYAGPKGSGPAGAENDYPLGEEGWEFIGWDWESQYLEYDYHSTTNLPSMHSKSGCWRIGDDISLLPSNQYIYRFASDAGAIIRFFAQWKPLPQTLTYHPVGPVKDDLTKVITGTWADSGTGLASDLRSETHDSGDTFALRDKSTIAVADYYLYGWNTEENGTGKTYLAGAQFEMPGKDTDLWAIWRENPRPRTLTYHSTGPVEGDLARTLTGTWADAATDSSPDRSESHNSGDVFALRPAADLTAVGYTLIAWNDKADGTGRSWVVGGQFEMPGHDAELWPIWREKTIDILYKVASGSSGGGTVDRSADRNVRWAAGSVILGSTPAAEEGYEFVRWVLASGDAVSEGVAGGTGKLVPTAASDGADDGLWEGITYYAEFAPRTYTLHYLDEDEETTLLADRTDVLWRETGLTPTPAKAGYKFNGWYYKTGAKGTGTGASLIPLTAAAYGSTPFSEIDLEDADSPEATIYASWVQEPVELTYEPDDSSHGTVSLDREQVAVGTGTPAGSLATAEPGWRFVRWERKAPETAGNTIKDASARWVKLEKSGDLWLADAYVAIFEEVPVVLTYEPDDPSHGAVSLASETLNAAAGTPAGSAATPAAGWRFVRWERKDPETAGNSIVNPYASKVSLAKNGNLWLADAYVAIFSELPVTLTYEPDDPSHGAVSLAMEVVSASSGTPAGSLATAEPGWRFVRWERKAPETAGNTIKDASAAKVELAKAGSLWVSDAYVAIFEEAPDYAILYDGNGADSGVPDDQTGLTFEDRGALRDPARRGYTFDGWFRSLDGRRKGEGDPMSDMQPVYSGLANEDRSVYSVTLHASWTPITYIVSFHPNGGVGQMDDQGFTYDVSDELDRNLFTYAGWRFAGWTDVDPGLSGQADAQKSHVTGNHYSDEQTVSNLAYIQDEVVDLWALWEREEGTEGGGTEGPGPEGGETDGPEGGETDGPGTKGQGTDDPEGIDSGGADEDATDTRGSDDGTDAKDTDAKSARTDAESGNGAGTGAAGSATATADGGEADPARSASAVPALASTSASRGATLAQTGDSPSLLWILFLLGAALTTLGGLIHNSRRSLSRLFSLAPILAGALAATLLFATTPALALDSAEDPVPTEEPAATEAQDVTSLDDESPELDALAGGDIAADITAGVAADAPSEESAEPASLDGAEDDVSAGITEKECSEYETESTQPESAETPVVEPVQETADTPIEAPAATATSDTPIEAPATATLADAPNDGSATVSADDAPIDEAVTVASDSAAAPADTAAQSTEPAATTELSTQASTPVLSAAAATVKVTIQHFRQQSDGSWSTTPDETWTTTKEVGTVLTRDAEAARAMGLGNSTDTSFFNTAYTGFRASSTMGDASFTVTANEASNVFKVFYDRGKYRLNYRYHENVNGDTARPTKSDLETSWTSEAQYFEVNTVVNWEAPIFQLAFDEYGNPDGHTWYRLLNWNAQWSETWDNDTYVAAGSDTYEMATFNGSGSSLSLDNQNNPWWAPGSALGVHQIAGPWNGEVVDLYLWAGVANTPLYIDVTFITADNTKGLLLDYGTSREQTMRRAEYGFVTPDIPTPASLDSTKYAFIGWTFDEAGTIDAHPEQYFVTNPITFFAQWCELATVNYLPGNQGTWSPSDTSYGIRTIDRYYTWQTVPRFSGQTDTETTNFWNSGNPAGNIGYRFLGWVIEGSADTTPRSSDYIATTVATPTNGILNIIAQWELVYVYFRFETTGKALDANGNELVGTEHTGQFLLGGDPAGRYLLTASCLMPQKPSFYDLSGTYELIGWSYGAASINASYLPGSSVTGLSLGGYGPHVFYPVWKEIPVEHTYHIAYDPGYEDGAAVTGATVAAPIQVIPATTKGLLDATGTRAGYKLAGWYLDRDNYYAASRYGNGDPTYDQLSAGQAPVNDTITLYAKWEEIPAAIQYISESLAEGTVTRTIDYIGSVTGAPLGSVAQANDGWHFVAWKRLASRSALSDIPAAWVTDETILPQRENVGGASLYVAATYVATFAPNRTYSVLYDGNGATKDMPSDQTGLSFDDKAQPRDPGRTGYLFDGWFRQLDAQGKGQGEAISVAEPIYSDLADNDEDVESVTLHAGWTPITYLVRFHANGGSGDMDDQTYTYDLTDLLSKNLFTYEGKKFVGWTDVNPGGDLTAQALMLRALEELQKSHVTGNTYADQQSVNNLAYLQDEVVDLWALWEDDGETTGGGESGSGGTGGGSSSGGSTSGGSTSGGSTSGGTETSSGGSSSSSGSSSGASGSTSTSSVETGSATSTAVEATSKASAPAAPPVVTAVAPQAAAAPLAQEAEAIPAVASTAAVAGTLAQTGDTHVPLSAFVFAGVLVLGLGLLARKDGWR